MSNKSTDGDRAAPSHARPSGPRRPAAALIAAARRLFTERGYAGGRHRGDRPRRRRHPRRPLPPLRRQARAARGRLRADRGRARPSGSPGSSLAPTLDSPAGGDEGRGRGLPRRVRRARAAARSPCTTAPAVLGWDRWREIGAANGLGLIEASLQAAIEAGEIRRAAGRADGPPADGRARRGGDAGRPRRGPGAAGRGDRGPTDAAGQPRVASRLRASRRPGPSAIELGAWAARRDSFCAYMRTSASCIASAGSSASAGIVTAPQEALTLEARSARGQRFGRLARRSAVDALARRR